jgi:hypothetical protein
MKSINQFGNVVISPSRAKGSRRFDPWPSHSKNGIATQQIMGVSGAWYYYISTILIDLNSYVYIYPTPLTLDEVTALRNAYQFYTSPSGAPGFFGEWYNYINRSQPNLKMTSTQANAWAALH